MDSIDWQSVNAKKLRENSRIMYNMLVKIASNKQPWCLKEVKDILDNIKKGAFN